MTPDSSVIVAAFAPWHERHPEAVELVLDQSRRAGLVSRLAPLGIAGGAVYDALIALTASSYELTLLTCDARAAVVYQRVGAPFKPL